MLSTKSNHTKNVFIVCFITLIVFLIRRYDGFVNAQFFTEDSVVFCQQYLDLGAHSIFKPYAGYWHLIPRLIAFISGSLGVGYSNLPLAFNLATLLVTLFVSVSLYFSAVKLKLRNKLVYATFFLFVPMGGEVFMNVTHVIWITSIYLIDFLFVSYYANAEQSGGRSWYLQLVVLATFSITGTCSLLLIPAILVILILERKKLTIRQLVPLAVVFAGGMIQLFLMKFVDPRKPVGSWTVKAIFTRNTFEVFTKNITDVFYLYFLSPLLKYKIIFGISTIIFCVLMFMCVMAYRRIENKRKYVLVLSGLAFWGSSMFVMGQAIGPEMRGFTALHNDPVKWANFDGWFTYQRYLFIPYVCIMWLLVVGYDAYIKAWNIVAYLLFLSFHYRELKNTLPDLKWKQHVQEYYEGKTDTIACNPHGWGYQVILPKKK